MKTTLLFLALIFGTLAIHVNVQTDEFWEDPDVEYFDLSESQLLSNMGSETPRRRNRTTTPSTTTAATTLPPTIPTTTTAVTLASTTTSTTSSTTTPTTLAPTTTTSSPTTTTTTTLSPTTIAQLLTTTKPRKREKPEKPSTATSNSTSYNDWQAKISVSQQAVMAEAFFKLYRELIKADRKNGTAVFPPLSCQTIVTEEKLCFICPPSFGILKMFEARCKWIPIANSGGFISKDGIKILSKDIYEYFRKMYANSRTNGSTEFVENIEVIDFSVMVPAENATGAIVPSNTVSLPPSGIQPIAGGYSFVPTDDPDVMKIVDFIVKELKTTNVHLITSTYDFKSITSVEKQIVAGANYKINLEFINKENLHLYCTVQIFDNKVASESTPSLISHSCV